MEKQMTTIESRAVGVSEAILSAAKRHLRLCRPAPHLVIWGCERYGNTTRLMRWTFGRICPAKTGSHTVAHWILRAFFIPPPADYLKQRRK